MCKCQEPNPHPFMATATEYPCKDCGGTVKIDVSDPTDTP